MNAQTEWDHNQWTRLYAKFESEFVELPRRLCMEIARLRVSPPVRKVLEIGCGDGKGLEYLRRSLPDVELVGIDPDPSMVKLARARLRDRALITRAAAEAVPDHLGPFDLILSYMNFHRWSEPMLGLKRLQRGLTENGMAYIVDVRGDISPRMRQDGLRCLPSHGTFRAVAAAQMECGVTVEELRCRLDEAGISAYQLMTGMPAGGARGVGLAMRRTGRHDGRIGEITKQLSAMEVGRHLADAQIHLFIYPQPDR